MFTNSGVHSNLTVQFNWLEACLPPALQGRDRRFRVCNNVMAHATSVPRLGAALIAAGFVEQVLADSAAGGPLEAQASVSVHLKQF